MGNYRDLDAWQASRTLAALTYRITDSFPAVERYGLVTQMRRAAVSVMSNIAEGTGRASDAQRIVNPLTVDLQLLTVDR